MHTSICQVKWLTRPRQAVPFSGQSSPAPVDAGKRPRSRRRVALTTSARRRPFRGDRLLVERARFTTRSGEFKSSPVGGTPSRPPLSGAVGASLALRDMRSWGPDPPGRAPLSSKCNLGYASLASTAITADGANGRGSPAIPILPLESDRPSAARRVHERDALRPPPWPLGKRRQARVNEVQP